MRKDSYGFATRPALIAWLATLHRFFTRVASLGLLTLSAASAGQSTAPNVYLSAQQSTQQSLAAQSQSDSHYPQYTEGACILIAAQIKRFEQQRFRC